MNPKNTHVDTTKAITHIGLCAGYGGIELGLKRAIPNLRTVALCEIEAFACANLVAKMEAGLMDAAPIWSDLKTFPWAEFRGKVDILTGGYPCQPFSAAGKRAGKDDPRHLWPWIADGIRLLRPRMCFFENVEGHITLGLSTVISDLEEMGYRTTWGIFSASEVGAPHQRKRVFILAYDQRQRIEEIGRQIAVGSQQHSAWDDGGMDNANAMAAGGIAGVLGSAQGEEQGEGLQRQRPRHSAGYAGQDPWPSRPGEPQHKWEPPRVVADANSQQSQRGRNAGKLESTPDPKQGETQKRERSRNAIGNQGSAGAIVGDTRGTKLHGIPSGCRWEKMAEARDAGEGVGDAAFLRTQGQWPKQQAAGTMQSSCAGAISDQGNWQAESSLGRDADGPTDWMDDAKLYVTCDNRTDELRLLGNGVVPATAERAFRVLMAKL